MSGGFAIAGRDRFTRKAKELAQVFQLERFQQVSVSALEIFAVRMVRETTGGEDDLGTAIRLLEQVECIEPVELPRPTRFLRRRRAEYAARICSLGLQIPCRRWAHYGGVRLMRDTNAGLEKLQLVRELRGAPEALSVVAMISLGAAE